MAVMKVNAGLGGAVRTSGRGCPGGTAGPGGCPERDRRAPSRETTQLLDAAGGDRARRVPGCFTGHEDHINPDRPEVPTVPKLRPPRNCESADAADSRES